ncbi:Amino-acid permease BAT1 [Zea mays]|uniref:Amino-acid permease BAT1 n=1 Tax=Zea mays TaxID=4577 RepID=A0A1D6NQR4_MAIZE|nr:Amino-acid permease BAT1 [Zea mays]
MNWKKSPPAVSDGAPDDADDGRLRELGYKQELKRHLSVLSNFSISFTVISVLTGVTTLYNTGLAFGGPATMTLGWFVAGAFTMAVGLSMAEICSAFPTSGGLYYWSARLSGRRWAPFASWITGWYGTASIDFSLAQLIQVIVLLSTGGNNGGGYLASKHVVFAFHAGILLSHAAINSLSITWLSLLGQFAALWSMLGVLVLMIAVPVVATERASAKYVFTHFNTDNSAGIHSNLYIFVLGLLMSQYTLSGYDASAHMTEETKNAGRNGPVGIITAIGVSLVVGWGYILGITFAVKDIPALLSTGNDAGGYAIAQVFYLAFKGRMTYAFSRDGAMPFSSVWHKVNEQEVPVNAVWLSAFVSLCMALPSLGSLVAFQAMASVATTAVYIAYALPILFRVTLARSRFVPGPFSLGRYGVLVGWTAVLWVATITVLFSLPVSYPVTKDTINYTPVAVAGLFALILSSWIVAARRWFTGPVTNLGG